jgi:hypothetical protein
MRTVCRRCESGVYPLTPVGYCYLCLSRLGMTTQIALLVMAYNPAVTIEDLQQCLRLDSRSTAEWVWNEARTRLEEEVKQEGLVLPDCRIHTRNSVIYRTVYIERMEATVGVVKLNDGLRPVYVVPGTDSRVWATSESDALYLGNRRKRRGVHDAEGV